MKSIEVSAERRYSVQFVGNYISAVENIVGDNPTVVVVPESLQHISQGLPPRWVCLTVPNGEAQKDGKNYLKLLNKLAQDGMSRATKIVAIGGGATTDLVGFVAATYLRGIDWIAVPTSLAGMVDAAIGGKTGINLDAGKNLAGAFYSPEAVLIDTAFLNTLPERDLHAGLAEVVKCGFIADPEILRLIQGDWRNHLNELISRAIEVKADVVSKDFKESDLREILNYGHTLGHAIEKHSRYELRHGECVSIGMVFAAELSYRISGLSEQSNTLHSSILKGLNLPLKYPQSAWPELYKIMQSDKKKSREGLRFVTLRDLARPTRAEDISEQLLSDIYAERIGE